MKKHQQLVKVLYFKGYRVDSRRTPLSKFPGFQFLNCGRTRRTPFLILGIGLLKIRLLKKINHVVKGQFEFAIFFFFFFYFFFTFFQAFFLFTLIGFVTCLEYHKLYARNAQAYGGQVYDKSLPYVPRYR